MKQKRHRHESEEGRMKRRNLNARHRRKAMAKVLFTVLSVVATLIVAFVIWIYTAE